MVAMSQVHVVQQGDCLASIAAEYGFADGKVLYAAAENAAFRKLRPDPNLIFPGDEVVIPDPRPKVLTLATGKAHPFVMTVPRRTVRVRLDLPDDRSLSGQPFELMVGEHTIKGRVADKNMIEAEVPAATTMATLSLPDLGLTLRLAVGHLDPVRHGLQGDSIPSGIQARLHNLGFFAGEPSGVMDAETTSAMCRFQRIVLGREHPDGAPDDETLAKLVDLHGC
jgi:N-acetylmuramoyl-L-alanine amidase